VTGSGQALAAALALAVAAVVTVFVRFKNDSGTVAVKPAASASASVSPARQQTACVANYFPKGSIDPNKQDFSFVCRAVDLRSTTKQLEKRLTDGGTRATTEGAKAWNQLGWFELPLAATMRHNCCEKHIAERIVLPQPPPNCKALSAVLKEMTGGSLTPGNLQSRARDFERAVECLTEEQQASAYGQDSPIGAENEKAFKSFLEREEQVPRQ
jgi:hypothetical protein